MVSVFIRLYAQHLAPFCIGQPLFQRPRELIKRINASFCNFNLSIHLNHHINNGWISSSGFKHTSIRICCNIYHHRGRAFLSRYHVGSLILYCFISKIIKIPAIALDKVILFCGKHFILQFLIENFPQPVRNLILKAKELPSKIVHIHLQEYKKRKSRYKIFIYAYFIITALLMLTALAQPNQTTAFLMLFSLLFGCFFIYPAITRMQACGTIISVILESYPELEENRKKLE